jgi:rubrerythrin
MALDLLRERGTPLEKQTFDWKDLVRVPISKLDDDAFTRVRIILMNGIEEEATRFGHFAARHQAELRLPLARVRRAEHFQQLLVNWLLPPDQSPLETTIGYEQVAIEVTASVAKSEPDPYLAQTFRFGLLEDFDHLYRYSALLDRLEGKDANNIVQSYSDIRPGRPTVDEHRAPEDDLRRHYDRRTTQPLSKLHALLITAGEQQTLNYYKNIGPLFSDPLARALYAEIASIEEQHVTQYECLLDPTESWLEKWVLHEATEVYAYLSCAGQETNPRIRAIWERFVDYELGHLAVAIQYLQRLEGRDAAEILPATLPEQIRFSSHRDFVREVLAREVQLASQGPDYLPAAELPPDSPSLQYRAMLNRAGSPSETVSAGYAWRPGTEQMRAAESLLDIRGGLQ